MTDLTPAVKHHAVASERMCEWCGIPHSFWQSIRCLETRDGMVFCSRICLEKWEGERGRDVEIVSELPFPWDRELGGQT